MNQQIVVQHFSATLVADISAAALTADILVSKGSLPALAGGDFIVLNASQAGDYNNESSWEDLKVTSWTGTLPNLKITFERNWSGTPSAWVAGSKVDCRLPEKTINNILKKVKDMTPGVLTGNYNLVNSDSGMLYTYSGNTDITVYAQQNFDSDWAASFLAYGKGRILVRGGSGVTMDNLGATCGAGTVVTVRSSGANRFVCQNPVVNGPVEQAHWTVPFLVYASGSWTFGANGAVTFSNGQLTIHPAAYVYFPAGSITATNVAGWYFTVFSSVTVAKVYQETYDIASGLEPEIPSSPTAFSAAAGSNVTQTTGNIQGPTCVIPGGSLGKKGAMVISCSAQANNTTNVKTIYAGLGSASTAVVQFNSTNSTLGEFESVFQNMNNEARQMYRNRTNQVSSYAASTYLTQDTTADLAVCLSFNVGTVAGDWVSALYARVATISKG